MSVWAFPSIQACAFNWLPSSSHEQRHGTPGDFRVFSLPLIIPSVLDSVNEGYLNGASHSLLAATGHFVDADKLDELYV